MNMINRLNKLPSLKLWLIFVFISLAISELFVCILQFLLAGHLDHGYLVTSFVVSLFVSGFMVSIFIYFLNRQKQSNAILNRIVDSLPIMVFLKSAKDLRFEFLNRAGEELLGRSQNELLTHNDYDFFPETQADFFTGKDREVLNNKGALDISLEQIETPTGIRYLHTKKLALLDGNGHAKYLLGISEDISERKKTEDALRESEEKLRGLYELSPLGIALTDKSGRFLEFNESFRQICGYTEKELKEIDYWELTPRKYAEAESQQIELLLSTGHYGPYEKEYIRKDGSYVSLCLNGILLTASNGQKYIWSIVEDITERKKAEVEVWTQANFDQLTQLPNRRLFTDRLEQELKKAQRDNYLAALLFIDLDHFKEINDTLGHEFGDLLLIEASRRIKSCVRDTDTVARLGGDEFTIILSEFTDNLSDVERIAQKIINHLAEPYVLNGQERFLSASLGLSIYPYDATSITDLLKFADQAMYVAKNEGRNRFRFFTKAMQDDVMSRSRMANDLRHALHADQLEVYYQPIVDLHGGLIHKAEALLRWKHPEHGFIPPSIFIPIAEYTGTIHDIGGWVFSQAAKQVEHWQKALETDFQISVNKSPVQFRNESSSYTSWPEELKKLGLSGKSIVVEITEGSLMDASPVINNKLLGFRDAGIQVSIDDFGTGYSSLAYLKKFDIDFLKIDQSFIRNLSLGSDDMALCEAIVVMAHKLNIKVIAEGVETEEQKNLLIAVGCDYGQGYLFSRPVPPAEFEALLF